VSMFEFSGMQKGIFARVVARKWHLAQLLVFWDDQIRKIVRMGLIVLLKTDFFFPQAPSY
jgi:hypothetical protein